MDDIPPLESQKEIYEGILNDFKLTEGSNVYLISTKWLNNFKKDTGFFGQNYTGRSTCGPIDNKHLYTKNQFVISAIKEHSDYEIIPQDLWDSLHEWYDGGPEITLPVVGSKTGPKILFSKLILRCFFKNMTPKEIETNKYVTVKELRETAMKIFHVPVDKEARLWDYWKKEFKNEMKDEFELSKYSLYDNQEIFLDIRENGAWDKDNQKANYDIFSDTLEATKNNQYNDNVNYINNNANTYNSSNINNNNNYLYNPVDQIPEMPREKAPAPGVVGLLNIGNTCFFNAVLQCLFHNVSLEKIFLDQKNLTLNAVNETQVVTTFQELMRAVWSGDSKVITPSNLKIAIGQIAPQFANTEQQDSHEFLITLLTGLHDGLNKKNRSHESVKSIVGDGSNDEQIAKEYWEGFKKKNDSPIIDTFYGQYRSILHCPNCNSITTNFDPYDVISLPLSLHYKKLKVIFIPISYTDPYIKMELDIPFHSNFTDISKLISDELQRPVQVIIGGYRILDEVDWGFLDYTAMNQPHLLAFEVLTEDCYYVPCYIEMNEKSGNSSYVTYNTNMVPFKRVIGKLFILPFDHSNVTEFEVAEAAEQYLQCLWEPYPGELPNTYIQDLIEQNKYYSEPPTSALNQMKDRRIITEFPTGQFNFNKGLQYDPNYPKLEKVPFKLFINPKFMSNGPENTGFSFQTLYCHMKPKKEKSLNYNDPQMTLGDCFNLFNQNEKLDERNKWHCPKCNTDVRAEKKMDIWSAPDSLIINFKRFSDTNSKIETYVDYPIEFDLNEYLVGPQKGQSNKYRLYGVTEHMGGVGSGHYTAHVRVIQKGQADVKWYSFNDNIVTEADEGSAVNRTAYILFYQKIQPDAKSDNEP